LTHVNRESSVEKRRQARGKLRIGDDWNAITIIALSQSSPLKAIAELVENTIPDRASVELVFRFIPIVPSKPAGIFLQARRPPSTPLPTRRTVVLGRVK
jgi:hypothetical protein